MKFRSDWGIVLLAALLALGTVLLQRSSAVQPPVAKPTASLGDRGPAGSLPGRVGRDENRVPEASSTALQSARGGSPAPAGARRRSSRSVDAPPLTVVSGLALEEHARRQSGEADPEKAEDPAPPSPLSGRVLDTEGGPVPGLDIVASPRLPAASGDSGQTRRTPVQARTTTDRSGHFEFPGLAEGEYRIRSRETKRFKAAETVARSGVSSVVLVVEEQRDETVRIYGKIFDQDSSTPLAGVRVRGGGVRAGPTDASGVYSLELPLGGRGRIHTLRFTCRGWRDESRQLGSDEVAGREEIELNVSLRGEKEPAPVAGSVSTTRGEPIHGAVVRLFSAQAGRRHQTVTDRGGRFRFPEVESQTEYVLRVKADDRFEAHTREGLWLPREGLVLPVVLEAAGFGSLSGRMIDSLGRTLPHLTLWMRTTRSRGRLQQVAADRQGSFHVDDVAEGPVSFLTLSEPRFTVHGIEAAAGQHTQAELVVDWGEHSVQGAVLDLSGRPIAGAQLTLSWRFEGNGTVSRSVRRTVSDLEGRFALTRLGPGGHTLSVQAPGFRAVRREVAGSREEIVQLQSDAPSAGVRP